MRPFIDRCVSSQIRSKQLYVAQVDSSQGVEVMSSHNKYTNEDKTSPICMFKLVLIGHAAWEKVEDYMNVLVQR